MGRPGAEQPGGAGVTQCDCSKSENVTEGSASVLSSHVPGVAHFVQRNLTEMRNWIYFALPPWSWGKFLNHETLIFSSVHPPRVFVIQMKACGFKSVSCCYYCKGSRAWGQGESGKLLVEVAPEGGGGGNAGRRAGGRH